MEQFLSHNSVQIGNRRVSMRAVPMMAQQGIAYFTFIAAATPENPSESRTFRLDQASLLEEHPRRLLAVAQMLSSIWGPIDDPVSFATFRHHLSVFCHQIIQQRNGLAVGFYVNIFSHTAGILQQQRGINTNIRGASTIGEGRLVFTASERGLDQTAIANLEKLDAAGVLNHDECCSICFEKFKETMDDLGLARTPCSHMFHYDCIAHWLKTSATCPLCRREMC